MDLSLYDDHLRDYSYIGGYTPTHLDKALWTKVKGLELEELKSLADKFPNLHRWHNHIASFSQSELDSFPKSENFENLVVGKNVTMVKTPSSSDLSPAEKKQLITRNLQVSINSNFSLPLCSVKIS